MEHLSRPIKECIFDKKPVKEEVNRFRSEYQRDKYSYDKPLSRQSVRQLILITDGRVLVNKI
jgi:hypothetical protein